MQIARSLSLAALLAVVGVGCSSPAGTTTGNDALNATGDGGTSTYDPEYLVFPARADAETWFTGLKPLLGAGVGSPGTILPATDPRFARVQKIVDKHWAAILPKYAPNIPPPVALLVDSDVQNAFAVYDPRVKKEADGIVILSAILTLGDADVEAIVAHELGHLVTKNAIPSYQAAVFKYYKAPLDKEPLGIEQNDDPTIRAQVEPYRDDATEVGEFSWAEFHGIPVGNGLLSQFWSGYITANYKAANPGCAQFATDYNAMQAVLSSGVTADQTTIVLNAAQLASLDTASKAVEASSVTCMKPPAGTDFFQALADKYSLTRDQVVQAFPQDKVDIVTGKDALTGLFGMVDIARARLRQVKSNPDFPQFRYYTQEEQADDFAMGILKAEGTSPENMGAALLSFEPADQKTACTDMIAANTVPAYGDLSDPHHSNCYRAFHAHAFKAYLDAGGAGVLPVGHQDLNVLPVEWNPAHHRILVD